MHLKKIELYGFKTFSKKTTIPFEPGFLAVVGPNGSGKSNLTDAIRFCLGESNSKVLRAPKLEQLVFSGTPEKPASPYAEVTLFFDNSDDHLPVALSEIAITRRLDKNGSSKFFLNGSPCRMKDIHELLMGSGIGPGSFSVLGRTEVDKVLSNDPMERRSMLEETAGVNRYKFRKKEALNRLRKTQDNLVRIGDIEQEIEKQVREAKKQLDKYEQYHKLQEDLVRVDLEVFVTHWDSLEQQYKDLQEQLTQVQAERAEIVQTLEVVQKALNESQIELKTFENSQDSLIKTIAEARELISRNQATIKGLEKQIEQAQLSFSQLDGRRSAIEKRLENQNSYIKSLQENIPDYQSEHSRTAQAIADLEATLSQLPDAEKSPMAQATHRLLEAQQKKAGHQEQKVAIKARQEVREERLLQLQQDCCENEEDTNVENALTLKLEQQKQIAQNLTEEHQKQLLAHAELQQHQKSLKERKFILDKERRTVLTELGDQEALLQQQVGVPRAVKEVLKWGNPGVLGLLGDLITVPQGLEQAFEAALKSKMHDIVVDTRATASDLIQKLKRNRTGHATFWPLDLPRKARNQPVIRKKAGILGPALSLLSYDPKVHDVLTEILGKTVVAESMDSASQFYRDNYKERFHLVTLDGEYLSPSGSLTGGHNNNKVASRLTVQARIRQSQELLSDFDSRLDKTESELESGYGAMQDSERTCRELEEQARQARHRLEDAERELKHVQNERIALQQKHDQQIKDKEKIEHEIEGLNQQLLLLEDKLKEQDQIIVVCEEEVEQHRAEQSRVDKMRMETLEQLSGLRVQQESNTKQIRDLEKEIEREQGRLEEILVDQKSLLTEEHGLKELCERARQEQHELTQEVDEKLEWLKSQESNHKDLLERIHGLHETVKQHQDKKQNWEHKFASSQERSNALLIEQAGLKAQYQEAREKRDYFLGKGHELDELRRLDGDELEQAKTRKVYLRDKIENFGAVNLGAREDYEKLSTRHDELVEQISDLSDGAEQLEQIIAQLDKATVAKFKDAFESVNHTFQHIFKDIFGGGQAALKLCDAKDILHSGVDIIACPPGKKQQNLSLLSSGERALSAIAFLLALLTEKPSPVIILDELDAPLDERNVEKVAKRLMDFSDSSQFLVVTHNRKTMEFADILFGVTMQEPGCSQIFQLEMANIQMKIEEFVG